MINYKKYSLEAAILEQFPTLTKNFLPAISDEDFEQIDSIFFDTIGNFKVNSAEEINAIDPEKLAYYCNREAIYGIPSTELIQFLKEEIGDKKAIEIGAGHGYLGQALGIIQTDSYLQFRPDIAARYKMLRQPIINYPERVRKFDALEAIRRFKPQIVIGSWITHKGTPANPKSSTWGVDEEKLLKMVDKYIVIGHTDQHDAKFILKYPHRIIQENWICSRSLNREGNIIYIWDKKR